MRNFATLDELRAAAVKGVLILVWGQVALNLGAALLLGAPWAPPLLLGLLLAIAATGTWALTGSGPASRLVVAVALIGTVSLVVAELDGSPWQIDGHMCFFAALAVLAALCDWLALLLGAAATAAHHLVLNGLLSWAVFPGGTDYGRVVLHAVIVVVETAALIWLTYQLAALFAVSAEARRAAEEARRAEIATLDARRADEAAASARARAESDALASRFEVEIGGAVREAVAVAEGMSGNAGALSGTVAEVSTRIATVVAASSDTAASVQTVAAAAGRLAHSVAEITRTVGGAATVAARAVAETQRTEARVTDLAAAAQRIGEVVTLIRGIAGQTNLLALNANIEAARAGETGRGFGVVAAEVKALATQTASATETIQAQIEAIRAGTGEAAAAIAGIAGIVGEVGTLTDSIAEAVREQGEATAAIARSTEVAAGASDQVSANLGALASHAEQTGVAAVAGRAAAEQLFAQCGQMARAVSRFVETVKAA